MRRSLTPLLFALTMSGCVAPAPEDAGAPSQPPDLEDPPAAMSHGEARVADPRVPLEREAAAPARSSSRLHRLRMTTSHVSQVIAPNVVYAAWTFDSVVPGPVVRVTVGDTVEFTLVNTSPMPHSMDFHAAEIAPTRAYINVNPGDSLTFRFVPRVPGAFMYHCGTAPVAAHIANGMYGALIVDPVDPLPPAREFVLVQSEFYLSAATAGDSLRRLAWDRLLDMRPDHVVFNGVVNQYAGTPIRVEPGELLRFYVVNAGPNRVSAFHVVGAIFDRVRYGGFGAPIEGIQTFNVPVGGGAVFETRLAEEGLYPFVTHAFSDATKGAVGMLQAGEAAGAVAH